VSETAAKEASGAAIEDLGFPLGPESSAPYRRNVGDELDQLVRMLPSGAAREFARGLPRRLAREELLANLEALVRILHATEHQA
jgi:hypothetical protein